MATDERSDLVARLAVLEERLAELESREPDLAGIESLLARLFPPEVQRHLRTARKEQLLAVRAMLDHWIERVDRAPAERVRRRERIKLE